MASLPSEWMSALDAPWNTQASIDQLVSQAYQGFGAGPVLPSSRDEVFRAFELTALADVRAVIVGQDPYPDAKLAHGVAFSAPGASQTSALKAIFTNLEASGPDIRFSRPNPHNGDLTGWADRGILMLNASLTHEKGKLDAHCRLWMPLLKAALLAVSRKPESIPVLLLGGRAVDLETAVARADARVLTGHPTPRNTQAKRFPLFARDRPFVRGNTFLTNNLADPIDWSLT
jgi:uracil-DNA glycosylase